MTGLAAAAAGALVEVDLFRKLAMAHALEQFDADAGLAAHHPVPVTAVARPARPVLVSPSAVPRRGLGTLAGRVALVHAVAHIEANAVNLALDAVQRFTSMPAQFRRDWAAVAAEEATHCALLCTRLRELGAAYGDLPAHDGLWQAAVRSAEDPLVRMALVPRVLEARGLDVTPGMISRLEAVGDLTTAAILRRILADEIGHVAVGSRWFVFLCEQRGLDPQPTFAALLAEHGVRVPPPLNLAARAEAGFSPEELARLDAPGRRAATPPG